MKRNESIDFLRGLGIIAMIFIHTSYYFLGEKWVIPLWEYAQFAVPVFVFCSAYLFFSRKKEYPISNFKSQISNENSSLRRMFVLSFEVKKSLLEFTGYIKKRAGRLLKPYYIFLIFFIPLIWFKQHSAITLFYIFNSIITWNGGAEIDWLVLLFFQFIFVMPFIQWSYRKNKLLFYGYLMISVLTSILFIFHKFPYQYQWIMGLTWSPILFFAFYFVRYEATKWFKATSLSIFGILYILSAFYFSIHHFSLSFYDNKYPPDFYFLVYGIFSIIVLYYLEQLVRFKFIHKIIHFFSIYSYPIFFIHYWILTFLQSYLTAWHFTIWSFFGVVIISTIFAQNGFIFMQKKLFSTRRV